MSRYGKPIKNKKRIDPRYFLHEAAGENLPHEDAHKGKWKGDTSIERTTYNPVKGEIETQQLEEEDLNEEERLPLSQAPKSLAQAATQSKLKHYPAGEAHEVHGPGARKAKIKQAAVLRGDVVDTASKRGMRFPTEAEWEAEYPNPKDARLALYNIEDFYKEKLKKLNKETIKEAILEVLNETNN